MELKRNGKVLDERWRVVKAVYRTLLPLVPLGRDRVPFIVP